MKRKRFKIASIILAISILMGAVVTVVVLYEYHRLTIAMPADVVKELRLFWGTELLILAARQILGSDVIQQANKTKQSKDEEASI